VLPDDREWLLLQDRHPCDTTPAATACARCHHHPLEPPLRFCVVRLWV